MSECVVYRLVSTYRKNDIGTSSCKNRIKERSGIDDLNIDLNPRVGSKRIVNHSLKNSTLITSGKHPNLNNIVVRSFIIHITD